jgi:MFS transporter, DHA2 family, multidrug resistance protein
MRDSNNVLELERRPSGGGPARTVREGLPVLAALMLITLVVTIDNTVLNVALPSIARDLDASTGQLQWIVNAYSLLFGGLLLTGGSLADRLGRRRVLLGGLSAFAFASLLVLLVSSAGGLIAVRAVTGACAAFLMPSTIALLYRSFEGPARGTAIGIAGAAGALGFVLGPLIGGALLEAFAWQAVFVVNVPLAAVGAVVAWRVVPPDVRVAGAAMRPADLRGTVLSLGAMVGLVAALVDGPEHGWLSALVLGPAVVSALCGWSFVRWELRAPHPMLDVRAVAQRGVAGPGVVQVGLMLAIGGALFLITQQLQVVMGYSPIEAGVRSSPIAVGVIGGGVLLSLVSRWLGVAWAAALGLLGCSVAIAVVALALPGGAYWPLALGLLTFGAGVRMVITPAALAIFARLPEESAGIGAALADTFQEIGVALGVALLGSVFNEVYRHDLPAGAPGVARASIQGAVSAGDAGLASAAREAFASGAQVALLVCAGILVVVAFVAWRTIPADLDLSEEGADAVEGGFAEDDLKSYAY